MADFGSPVGSDPRQARRAGRAARTLEPVPRTFVPHAATGPIVADQSRDPGDKDLWVFRRILARELFTPGFAGSDVTVVNWPMIDHLPGPLIGVSDEQRDKYLDGARQLALSMLYWLQTEAPRPDGGAGWPGLRLRPDVMGRPDGLAKAQVHEDPALLARFQDELVADGFELAWPEVRGY